MRTCGKCKHFIENSNPMKALTLHDGSCGLDKLFVDRDNEFPDCWQPLPATVEKTRELIGGAK